MKTNTITQPSIQFKTMLRPYLLLISMLLFGGSIEAQNQLELIEISHPEVINLGCEFPIKATFQNYGNTAFYSESWQLNIHLSSIENQPSDPLSAPAELSIAMPPIYIGPGETVCFQRLVPAQWDLLDETNTDEPDDLHRNIVIVWGGEIAVEEPELLLKTSELDVSTINTGEQDWAEVPDPAISHEIDVLDLPEDVHIFMQAFFEDQAVSAQFYGFLSFPFFGVEGTSGIKYVFDLGGYPVSPSDACCLSPEQFEVLSSLYPDANIEYTFYLEDEENLTFVVLEGDILLIWEEASQNFLHDEEFIDFLFESSIPIEILDLLMDEFQNSGYTIEYSGLGGSGIGYTIFTDTGEEVFFDGGNNFIYSVNVDDPFFETIATNEIPFEIVDLFEEQTEGDLTADWFFTASSNCGGFYSAVTENNDTFIIESDGSNIELSTGINDQHEGTFSVYPNPTQEKICINSSFKTKEAYIYSLDGQLLLSKKADEIDCLDLNNLPYGNYLLEARSKDISIHRMFSLDNLGW